MLADDDDDILCDADYDSASEELDPPEDTEQFTWNRDTQVVVGNGDLARDDEVWEQPVPDIHHQSPPAVLLPRVQSQDELDRMHHLGAAYFVAEDQPLQFKFKTPLGSLSTSEMGEETSVSSALRPIVVFVVVRRRFGVLLVARVYQTNVLPQEPALHLFGNPSHNRSRFLALQ
jgi:hypothetical protein